LGKKYAGHATDAAGIFPIWAPYAQERIDRTAGVCYVSTRERTESGDRIPDIVHSRDGDDGFRLRKILDRPRPTTSLRWARGAERLD
jgi:hypothetical protein